METPVRLNPGDYAPDFTLPDQDDRPVTLSSFRGKKVVLFFYPEDDSPLCTAEACSISASYSAMQEKNTIVFGISPDTCESHKNFHESQHFPFSLLADPKRTVHDLYGTWGQKNMYGHLVTGVFRHSFLIDETGRITKIFRKVNTKAHGEEILRYI